MVQPHQGFRLPDARRGDRGHFRPYGNASPLRPHRAAAGPGRAGAVRARGQGPDGGGNPSRQSQSREPVALMRISFPSFIKSALAALFLILAGSAVAQEITFPRDELSIRTAAGQTYKFSVELAFTDAQRERGLMYRKVMAPDAGMLFDFGMPRPVSMWMENTILPL